MTMAERGEQPFDWGLLALAIHPTKVAIIETLRWIDRPLSATDLRKVFGDPNLPLSAVSYHVSRMADLGILKKSGSRRVRAAIETFYVLGSTKA